MSDSKDSKNSKIPDRNNTSFPLYVHEFLSHKDWIDKQLLYHQHLVREYLLGNPHLRGILIFHGMGMGKTKLAARIIKDNSDRRVILIAPRGVQGQFQGELVSMAGKIDLQTIALKSPTLVKQLEESVADELVPTVDSFSTLSVDNALIVIDEAHNFFNAVVNGSKNAVDLYDMIMHAKNVKLVFLTGSPIINHPFELVPCFNMLAGMKLFPESIDDFEKYFMRDGHFINQEKFKNRIMGLVSYFGDWIRPPEGSMVPTELPLQVIRIPMSDPQYAIYSTLRDKEREESKRPGKRKTAERFKAKAKTSTYRIRSRQASNLVPIGGATDDDIKNPLNSPKFHEALKIIMARKDQVGMVYDNLVHACGLEDFARLLDQNGWTRWSDDIDDFVPLRYAIITGDTDPKEREQIRLAISGKPNKNGAVIRLVLVGPAVAEGLDLKNARYGIIMSPFFNYTRIDQAKSRIIRHLSLEYHDKKDWTVQIYILLSDYPKWVKNPKESTTDVQLFENAKKGKQGHLEFYRALIEVSIDCSQHRSKLDPERQEKIHCKMCAPTGMPLFQERLDQDLRTADPCKEPKVETVKVQELFVEDVHGTKHKFMYQTDDGIHKFYEFSTKLNGYIPVNRAHPYFNLLIQAVESETKESKEQEPEKIYRLRVSEPWFSFIENGVKKVEGRMGKLDQYDWVGKRLVFNNDGREVKTHVTAVRHYNTLDEYLSKEGLGVLPGIESVADAKAVYNKFWSDERIASTGGIVAIEFTLG